MRRKKIRQLGISSFYVSGAGLLIVIFLGIFLYGYDSFRKTNSGYSYDDLKGRNEVVLEQEIYDFMNFTFFDADSLLADKREFMKLDCFTLIHGSNLKKFIKSQADTILTSHDKDYIISQMERKTFLWDQDKFINVWCLTPKDLYRVRENDTLDYWQNFRKNFGNYGHHHYSKPIFNKDKTIVIVEHSGQGDWLFGSGEILIFRKERGKWTLIKEQTLWIS